ncbi:MAG: glycosyltransferase [Actinomycetota bacterium]|nr:glycosyltransferase [Actinomycetota bacterium]
MRRILFVTSSLARFGADPLAAHGNAVADLLEELGGRVCGTVLAPAQHGAPAFSTIGGLTVRRIRPARPDAALYQSLRGPGAARLGMMGIAQIRAVRRLAADHDLVHGLWAYPAGVAAVLSGKPSVVTFPGSDVHAFAAKPVTGSVVRSVVRRAGASVAVDPVGASLLADMGARRVEHVPTPIRIDKVLLCEPEASSEIITVGRLSAEKGVDVLLSAFALVRQDLPHLRLTVVGDGPEAPRLRAQADVLGLAAAVSFTGALGHAEVLDRIGHARLLVVSSHREGLPSAALEALATGRPVVATAVGGLPELLGDGSGVVVPPGSPPDLAGGILHALSTTFDPLALRRRAEQYDRRAAAARYVALYEQLLGGARVVTPAADRASGQSDLAYRGGMR